MFFSSHLPEMRYRVYSPQAMVERSLGPKLTLFARCSCQIDNVYVQKMYEGFNRGLQKQIFSEREVGEIKVENLCVETTKTYIDIHTPYIQRLKSTNQRLIECIAYIVHEVLQHKIVLCDNACRLIKMLYKDGHSFYT